MDRRTFIKTTGAFGLGFTAFGIAGCKSGFSRTASSVSNVSLRAPRVKLDGVTVARGSDAAKITRAAIHELGGMSKFVKNGDIVAIKPNIAFDRKPDQAATTNPDVVAELVRLCLEAGAKTVKVFDNPCNDARRTYKHSGIEAAAGKAGAEVKRLQDSDFVDVKIPKARVLTSWWLSRDILEADVFISAPIAKHHGATGLTLGMKNLMGCAGGQRGGWHVAHLDQRIADVNTAIRPDLVVLDAFRILTDHGPTGGSLDDVKLAKTVLAGTDIVAVDAYATTLFDKKPEDILYIKHAYDLGLGEMDLAKIRVNEVTA